MQQGREPDRREAEHLLASLASLASRAGARILEIVATDLATRAKPDRSPVTAADEAAEEIILAELERLLPGVPAVAEEAVARGVRFAEAGRYWLVDPIDGTKELIAGSGEYTVNIALIENRRPVLGIIYAPMLRALYAGGAGGAQRQTVVPGAAFDPARAEIIHTRPRPASPVAVISRTHRDRASEEFLARHGVTEILPLASSLKFARLAEGAADLYARLATVNQWDIAAGDAILTAAGGSVTLPDGSPLLYERTGANFKVEGFVAWGAKPAG